MSGMLTRLVNVILAPLSVFDLRAPFTLQIGVVVKLYNSIFDPLTWQTTLAEFALSDVVVSDILFMLIERAGDRDSLKYIS